MKSLILALLVISPFGFTMAQDIFNLELLSNKKYPEKLSDVWGFVKNSTEYAIVGTHVGTSILSLEDPKNPIERINIPGSTTQWRDPKNWGDFIYVVSETRSDGILIVDMSQAPSTINWKYWKDSIDLNGSNNPLVSCHNLFIDENGIAYLSGCNRNLGGIIMLDLKTDPWNPKYIGHAESVYSHDNFTRGDTCWSANIYEGKFSVINVKNKQQPEVITKQYTSGGFTHSTWLSNDGKYLFTADERHDKNIDAYDISDLNNITLLDTYQPLKTQKTGIVPHNVVYHNGWLLVSWYTAGVVVIDAHKPDNLVMVGQYDTNNNYIDGFHGCWGVYPFLPSGILLVSDIENGLFIFKPEYKRACYLEGTITDVKTQRPVPGASIKINSIEYNQEKSNSFGIYKTGQLLSGTFEVLISSPGYKSRVFTVSLKNGETTILDVTLQPLELCTISGKIVDSKSGKPYLGIVDFVLFDPLSETISTQVLVPHNGEFQTEIYKDEYNVVIEGWGILPMYFKKEISNDLQNWIIPVEKGYKDDCYINSFWYKESSFDTPKFELSKPMGSFCTYSPKYVNEDVPFDKGEFCYVTGNGGPNSVNEPIKSGIAKLISQPMDLTFIENPVIEFYTWFYSKNTQNNPDTLYIKILDADKLHTVKKITSPIGIWDKHEIIVSDYTKKMARLEFIVEVDLRHSFGSPVEAGFDAFSVKSGNSSSNGIEKNSIIVFPNPSSNAGTAIVNIDALETGTEFSVYNYMGALIERRSISEKLTSFNFGENYLPGLYILVLHNGKEVDQHIKWLKM